MKSDQHSTPELLYLSDVIPGTDVTKVGGIIMS